MKKKSGEMQVFESVKKEILGKRGTHASAIVFADGEQYHLPLAEQISNYLEGLHKGKYFSCSECGGIMPELVFWYKDRRYEFVCTKISGEKDKLIAETDYKLLEKQCHRINRKR